MLIAVILSLFILGGLTYHLRKRRLLANDKKPTVTRAPTTPEQAARMLEEYLLEFQRLRALAANVHDATLKSDFTRAEEFFVEAYAALQRGDADHSNFLIEKPGATRLQMIERRIIRLQHDKEANQLLASARSNQPTE
jgi:hypothetical protein